MIDIVIETIAHHERAVNAFIRWMAIWASAIGGPRV